MQQGPLSRRDHTQPISETVVVSVSLHKTLLPLSSSRQTTKERRANDEEARG
ncbi:MAG TPA: hypothetical protein VEL31_06890 [Ktedonobacteraceae bacterium]|nr:hypothetical protein [Ktedonobacteraceae bacterium]